MWAFRTIPTNATILSVELGRFRERRPTIKSGQQVALFQQTTNGVVFWGVGKVQDLQEFQGDESVMITSAVLVTHVFSDEPRELNDFLFSLEKVERFNNPQSHFRRRYVTFSSHDIDVIRDGRINWPRTAIGLLALALPFEDRLEIAASALESGSSLSYEHLAKLMIEYIKQGCAQLSRFVISAVDDAKEFAPDLPTKIVVGSTDDDFVSLTDLREYAESFMESWKDGTPFKDMLEEGQAAKPSTTKLTPKELSQILLFP